jgi:hypothetical protein
MPEENGMIIKAKFVIPGTDRDNKEDIARQFIELLGQLKPGMNVKVTMEVENSLLKQRKLYFALVTELAKEAGYLSHKDREAFKLQVKDHLMIKSVNDMETTEEIGLAIEGVYQLASEHYHYNFKKNGFIIEFLDRPDS